MTTATGADEVSFLTGMDREPPKKEDWQDVTVTLDNAGKKAWHVDGMLHGIMDIAGQALDKVRSLADRGPDPDYAPDRSLRPPQVVISGGGRPDWHKRRNSIIDGLLIAGIIALVSTSIYLLKTTVRLDTQYEERGQLYDERFKAIRDDNARQDAQLGRHDERLDRLEQQRRDAQRND
jgi:hypothetical protein